MRKLMVLVIVAFACGLFACSKDEASLLKYKTDAKTTLQTYAEDKGKDNYSDDNWAVICKAVTDGEKSIELATNKPAVDIAVKTAKAAMDKVLNEMGFVEIKTDGMIDCSMFAYNISQSWIGEPIKLQHPEENAVFECVVNNGSFSNSEDVKSIVVKPGEGFYWRDLDVTNEEQTFVHIVLKLDGNIIGYALIEIYIFDEHNTYRARVIKSTLLPKVDNQFQQVTGEQIETAIERAKA